MGHGTCHVGVQGLRGVLALPVRVRFPMSVCCPGNSTHALNLRQKPHQQDDPLKASLETTKVLATGETARQVDMEKYSRIVSFSVLQHDAIMALRNCGLAGFWYYSHAVFPFNRDDSCPTSDRASPRISSQSSRDVHFLIAELLPKNIQPLRRLVPIVGLLLRNLI